MIKKLAMSVTVVLAALFMTAPVMAAQDDPHHEETDGCDHGNSEQPCKPDPQPDHGQECEVHGNHGGINEDHCLNETTTTTEPPVTTTTTEPPNVTTTTTTVESSTTVPTEPPTTASPTGTPVSDSTPVIDTQVVTSTPVTELAHTGLPSTLWLLGMALLCVGAFLKIWVRTT